MTEIPGEKDNSDSKFIVKGAEGGGERGSFQTKEVQDSRIEKKVCSCTSGNSEDVEPQSSIFPFFVLIRG